MRKLVIGMALASTAIAPPALAREGSWYIETDFGGMIVEDSDFELEGVGDVASLDSDYGFDVGLNIGYDFGRFRLETEASYRRASNDTLESFLGVPDTAVNDIVTGSFDDVRGNANTLSFMINGLLDFGSDDGIQGFVGGGAGVGRVKYDVSINPNGPGFVDGTDTGFAWQALAGIRYPLSDRLDVGLKYRFFNVEDVKLVDSIGDQLETRWRSHSAMVTLAYNLGGVQAAPPPPPPPPPPPAPAPEPPAPEVTCNKGPYIVFFDWDRSDITPEAATVLDSAVTAYGNCDNVPIMLAGHTDRSGSQQYNMGLAERRNTSVRAYLTARGVADAAITSQAFGESNPRVPTADGVRELQNRRVEITYGPGSGM